ncbi:MAG: hypothetical protein Q9168_002851 [Polycauliona sp. 1 TL-2023]
MFVVILIHYLLLLTFTKTAALQPSSPPAKNGSSISLPPIPQLLEDDDPRFSMRPVFSETKLPPTAVLMCAIELAAQYAAMDYQGSAPQRHGIVLPLYPQVEVAIIPVPPARTVKVQLIIYTIYGLILEMMFGPGFFETEVEILWEGRVVAHLYFTLPLDQAVGENNNITNHLTSSLSTTTKNPSIPETGVENQLLLLLNTTIESSSLVTVFEWQPVYKPHGFNMPLFSIFLLCLGALKTIARFPAMARIYEPMHIGSDLINANLQIWPEVARTRPTPPYLRYGHVLEAVRRIPAWQLARRRFAEFFCGVEANGVPLGVIVLERGSYEPGLDGARRAESVVGTE